MRSIRDRMAYNPESFVRRYIDRWQHLDSLPGQIDNDLSPHDGKGILRQMNTAHTEAEPRTGFHADRRRHSLLIDPDILYHANLGPVGCQHGCADKSTRFRPAALRSST